MNEMKNEIHKMMNYLKIKEYTLLNQYDQFSFSVVYTINDTWRKIYMPVAYSLDHEDFQNSCLVKIHGWLIDSCRRKAVEKQTDVELANSGLFWCMYGN